MQEHQHLPKFCRAPHRVEVLIPSVTHYKKLKKGKVKSIGQVTLFKIILTQGLTKYRNVTLEDTYKESCTHEQEPPPARVVEFQLQATSRKC